MSLLRVDHISKVLHGIPVVDAVQFSQHKAQRLAIAGASGSGKTSLLKMIAGLIQPTDGSIFFREEKVVGPNDQLIPGHKNIAYLSQHFEMHNNYRVEELLEYASKMPATEAGALYRLCRIDHLLTRKTDQLSGGERQRIVLAKLLSGYPSLLLLDEPYSNLDIHHKEILKSVIENAGKAFDLTILMVSHDPNDLLPWADEILIMEKGRLIQKAKPKEVYHHPVNDYAAGLFGTYNLLDKKTAALFHFNCMPGKRLFVRPSHIKIVHQNGVKAIVKNAKYLGNHFELELSISGEKIFMLHETEMPINTPVYVSIETGNPWCI